MADVDDKEKAERIAAAKKKYEQLKKQKSKKGAAKKKDEEKAEPSEAPKSKDPEPSKEEAEDAPEKPDGEQASSPSAKPSHNRQPSMSEQSRMRSTSFRAGMGPTSPTSKSNPLSPTAEVSELYAKQSQRIEELEKENAALKESAETAESKWRTLEDEVQDLRESSSELSVLKTKASELDKLADEVAALKRQNAQLTQQLSSKKSRQESNAGAEADLKAELASKTATIDALELEISSLNARLSSLTTTSSDQATRIASLESDLDKATSDASASAAQLADLKSSLASKPDSDASTPDPQLALVQSELSAAQRAASDASARADKLAAKISTLTTLHREAETRHSSKLDDLARAEAEVKDLRTRLAAVHTENGRLRDEAARRVRYEAQGDAAGLDELEDEERARLAGQVRALEAEVFELRRGVWRDQRRAMQPGMQGEDGFDEVDLSASARGPASPGGTRRATSSFADVISSGISAFTGQDVRKARGSQGREGRPRKQSLGLLDDDAFEFDEDAFRKAQEEEAAARLERVKDVKRGLKKWEGWRVDIADLRVGLGEVYDI